MGTNRAYAVMVALLLEEVSRASGAVGSSLNAHTSLACSVIYHHGSDAQKRAYLTRLTTGQAIGAFGLTEPSAAPMPPPAGPGPSAPGTIT